MDKRELLRIIKAARALLEKHYVKWSADDGSGGHCSMGCVRLAQGLCAGEPVRRTPPELFLAQTAKRLHPELVGRRAVHAKCPTGDNFDLFPDIYVNNQLGKAAILAVYDAAIADLETDIAVEDLCAAEAEREPSGLAYTPPIRPRRSSASARR